MMSANIYDCIPKDAEGNVNVMRLSLGWVESLKWGSHHGGEAEGVVDLYSGGGQGSVQWGLYSGTVVAPIQWGPCTGVR